MNPLAAYRAEHSLTQVQLAAMLGVHPMTISKWERDLHRIPRAALIALDIQEKTNVPTQA